MTTPHGIAWEDVREVLASSLAVGDRWVRPGIGTTYRATPDGVVQGVMWGNLDGDLFTVTSREADRITVRGPDGRERSDHVPEHAHVLRVVK